MDADLTLLAYRRLACAILARAVRDAQGGNGHSAEARRWLAGEGAILAERLDIPPERITRWAGGLEPLAQPVLPGL